ncbi:MAG: hypothetical protein U0X75_08440 [Acidobacteriota bacterium]
MLERVRSLPSLQAAALTAHAPLTSGEGGGEGVFLHGDAEDLDSGTGVLTTAISTDYFRTTETRLLQGRDFTAFMMSRPKLSCRDCQQAFARRFFPENPIGKRLSFTVHSHGELDRNCRHCTKRQILQPQYAADANTFVYLPLAQNYESKVTLICRSAGDSVPVAGCDTQGAMGWTKSDALRCPHHLKRMELPLAPARMYDRAGQVRRAGTAIGSHRRLRRDVTTR